LCFSGCGGFLNLYNVKSNQLIESLDLFKGARIHGIRTLANNADAIIVFGGKSIKILNFNPENEKLR